MIVLTVISPFGCHAIGDVITDPKEIASIENSEWEVFVRRTEVCDPPAAPAEPAPEGAAAAEGTEQPAEVATPAEGASPSDGSAQPAAE